MPMPHIILKGVVTNLSLDQNGKAIATVMGPSPNYWGGGPSAVVGEPNTYKFEPYFNITILASDLGNPPLGATVDVEVRLS